jgi:hypothetical protein
VPDPTDLNVALLPKLQTLSHYAAGIQALAGLADFKGSYYHIPTRRARLAFSRSLFLLLQHFIAAFSHPPLLPGAYATLHAASEYHAYMCYAITERLRRHWARYAVAMGLPPPASRHAAAILPLPWAFAVDVFAFEYGCKRGVTRDEHLLTTYKYLLQYRKSRHFPSPRPPES